MTTLAPAAPAAPATPAAPAVPAASDDLAARYATLCQQARLPFVAETRRDGSHLIVRDLIVNLDDVMAAAGAGPNPPVFVSVYADIVRLPTQRNWALTNQALVIAARRVEATSGTYLQLDQRNGRTSSSVVVYAAEVVGSLSVTVFGDAPAATATFDLSDLGTGTGAGTDAGAQVGFIDGATGRRALATLPAELAAPGGDLWLSLSNLFVLASLLERDDPATAAALAHWVQRATAGLPVAADLSDQALGLAADLAVSGSAVAFVPALARTVYQDLVAGFVAAVRAYQDQYDVLASAAADSAHWLAAANQMQHQFDLSGQFDDQLLAQAQANLSAAQAAADAAGWQLKLQQLHANEAAETFKVGLALWKEDQILKAVFSIGVAIVTFAASIAAMAMGDEAAAAGAAGAVADAGKAAEQAAAAGGKAADLAGKLTALVKKMAGLKDALGQLVTTVGVVSGVVAATGKAGGLRLPDASDLSAQADWDAFRVDVDDLLAWVVDQQIGGAAAYRAELDKLSIYGKAFTATQSSLVAAGQEVVRLRGQRDTNRAMQASIDGWVGKLSAETAPAPNLLHLLYLRGLGVKRSLYLAARSYVAAYRYWALAESSATPSLLDDTGQLADELARMTQDYAAALGRFRPPPQDFGSNGPTLDIHVTDPSQLAALRTTGQIPVTVDLDDPLFAGFERVRLTTIRAWLDGVTPTGSVKVDLATAGVYQDRRAGTIYTFSSAPLQRHFEYSAAGIVVDGKVADEEGYAYFQPTPFAQWLITVAPEHNPGLDLSGLTGVRLSFVGSAIMP